MIQIGSKVAFIGPAKLRLFEYDKPYTVRSMFPNPKNPKRILIRLKEVTLPLAISPHLADILPSLAIEHGVWIKHFKEWEFGFEQAMGMIEGQTVLNGGGRLETYTMRELIAFTICGR